MGARAALLRKLVVERLVGPSDAAAARLQRGIIRAVQALEFRRAKYLMALRRQMNRDGQDSLRMVASLDRLERSIDWVLGIPIPRDDALLAAGCSCVNRSGSLSPQNRPFSVSSGSPRRHRGVSSGVSVAPRIRTDAAPARTGRATPRHPPKRQRPRPVSGARPR